MIAVFEIAYCTLGAVARGGPEEEAFAPARNDRNSPCPAAEPWLNLETSMCVPAGSSCRQQCVWFANIFCSPTSSAPAETKNFPKFRRISLNFGRNLLNFEFENEIYRKIPKFRIPVTSGNEKFSEISAKFRRNC